MATVWRVGERVLCPVMPRITTSRTPGTVVEVRGKRPFQEASVRYDNPRLERGPDWFWSRSLAAISAVDQLATIVREGS